MEVLFDGDVLVYKAGYLAETRHWEVIDSVTREVDLLCNGKREATAHIKQSDNKNLEAVMIQKPEPLSVATGIVDAIILRTLENLSADVYKVFITDSSSERNFREAIAKTKPYKGNRKNNVRPVHYAAIREYMVERHAATQVVGEEADDALGYTAMEDTTKYIVASIDKDLLMIPCQHYNIDKQELIVADDPGWLNRWQDAGKKWRLTGVGFKWFCAQMLLGDPVDNIEGIKGYGAVKTEKALDGHLTSEQQCWKKVVDIYREHEYNDDRLMETAQLLWIRRKREELFDEQCIPSR